MKNLNWKLGLSTIKSMGLAALVVGGTVACSVKTEDKSPGPSPDNDPTPYAEASMEGKIGGNNWSFRSGTAKENGFDAGKFSLTFTDEDSTDPCNAMIFPTRQVLVSVAKQAGETILGTGDPMSSATFYIQSNGTSQNLITTKGKVQLTSVTDTEISGKAVIILDDGNIVNGTFTMPVCHFGNMH